MDWCLFNCALIFVAGSIVRGITYNALGLLAKQTETGRAATLYEYDSLANLIRSGLDVDGNDQLELASSDRITDSIRQIKQDNAGDWFEVRTTTVYPDTGSDSGVQVSHQARRLSNFPLATVDGDLASETRTTDVNGNVTTNSAYIDRSIRTVTQITDVPNSDIPVIRVSINGLVVSQNSSTVAAPTTFTYDALERRISIKDPRHTQSSSIDYYTGTRQVFTQTDASGYITAYTYYDQDEVGAGQVKSVTNALNQKSYFAYDLLSRQIRTWGETDYPQAYSYNNYGELETLTTWRDSAGSIDFTAPTWPTVARPTCWRTARTSA